MTFKSLEISVKNLVPSSGEVVDCIQLIPLCSQIRFQAFQKNYVLVRESKMQKALSRVSV